MKARTRIISAILSAIMLLGCIPFGAFPAVAETISAATIGAPTYTADASTIDGWQSYFPTQDKFSTENAGGIWTDKSVFTESPFAGISKKDVNSFLVALSAIGSNMTVTGQASTATDTIFVLDVSGSMYTQNNDQGPKLAKAVNDSMAALLENPNNRVGVVLYSEDASEFLPLDRYTTGTDGVYITGNNGTIATDSELRDSNGGSENRSEDITGGTYIQSGIAEAQDMFEKAAANLQGEKRIPVIVLLSDGAATYATSKLYDPAGSEFGDGNNEIQANSFATQITAAYAKHAIEEKYGADCYMYTLGLGVKDNVHATALLDPNGTALNTTSAATIAYNDLWDKYAGLGLNGTMAIGEVFRFASWDIFETGIGGYYEDVIITKSNSAALDRVYADRYFNADSGDDLSTAFGDIVAEIKLRSAYHPTLVSDSPNTSGYISFVDGIGKHMSVTDVKGILYGSSLFSGASFAQSVVNGDLGTESAPTALGDEFVWSVRDRLGVTVAEARALIANAYTAGQLSYSSESNFSNYIGWYADASGKYIGFWHEGIETRPANAKYIMRSYGYIGTVDGSRQISDMMYTTVRVRHNIDTGEETVVFAIPAALLPLITYDVTLNASGEPTAVSATQGVSPIRLVYEVSLDPEINSFNAAEKIGGAPPANGTYYFYSNMYEADGSTGYGKNNTYSYFTPSEENDRYYYQSDSYIYTDAAGKQHLTSAPVAGETYYHAHEFYQNENGNLSKVRNVHKITPDTLKNAVIENDATGYYIKKGSIRRQYSDPIPKDGTSVNEVGFSAQTFADATYIGVTLGNNGRVTLQAHTGVKLTKALGANTTASAPFEFTVALSGATGAFPAHKIDANGNASDTAVTFANGSATVQLDAGETLYIGGMPANASVTVTEKFYPEYSAVVNGNLSNTATVTTESGKMASVAFTNTARGEGILAVTKEVTVPNADYYTIDPNKTYSITVNFKLDGKALAGQDVKVVNGESDIKTTDANGNISISLKHDQTAEISGIPVGTLATVTETFATEAEKKLYDVSYWDNGALDDGIVTVSDTRSSVIVVNAFNGKDPTKVYPVNIEVSGTKTYNAWAVQGHENDKFSFQLQRYDGVNTSTGEAIWTGIETVEVTSASPTFSFTTAFADSFAYTAVGTYYYRVYEVSEAPIVGVTYDNRVHSFGVKVTDNNLDGVLEIASVTSSRDHVIITKENDTYKVTTNFVNTYSNNGTEATIEILKHVTDNSGFASGITPAGFDFNIYASADGVTKGDLIATTQKTALLGTVRHTFEYTAEGTYYYMVEENTPDTADPTSPWTYDPTVYTVKVVVTNTGGIFTALAYVNDDPVGKNMVTIEFTNTYDPADATVDLSVTKELTGRDLKAGEFSFTITEQGQTDALQTVKNDADGTVPFAPLTFSKPGIYFYDIAEVAGSDPKITYDPTTYRLTVTVTVGADGKLEAQASVMNMVGTEIVFRNTFTDSYSPAVHSVEAKKVLTGRDLISQEFIFTLEEAIDADGTLKEGGAKHIARNTADTDKNNIVFHSITYTEAGDYYYVLKEQQGEAAGVAYSAKEYVILVKVTRVGDELKAEQSIVGVDTTNIPVFTNTYTAQPAKVTLTGKKLLSGKTLEAGKFTFELYKSDENATVGAPVQASTNGVTHDANGDFSFAELTFDAAGTYYYLVKEQIPEGDTAGITYDTKAYLVKIVVTDNGRGQLETAVSYSVGDVAATDIRFTNIYAVSGHTSQTVLGHKTLIGKTLEADTFSFELWYKEGNGAPDRLVETVTKHGADGNFSFTAIPFAAAGTYAFYVKEVKGSLGGITYDESLITVTVTVTDNGNGTLSSNIAYADGAECAEFTNTYTASGNTSATVIGHKFLSGKTLTAGMFSFELWNVTDNKSEGIVTNNADGSFSFAPLSYTAAGTYTYTVKEIGGGTTKDGIVYDGSVITVTVTVSDNGQGGFNAVTSYSNGKTRAEFTNTVKTVTPTAIIFSGKKTLENKALKDGDFTFLLYATDYTFNTNGLLPIGATTNSGGQYMFYIPYGAGSAGQAFHYVIKEANAGRTIDNITYSAVEYKITVIVQENAQGQLFTIAGLEGGGSLSELNFTNVYNLEPTSEILEAEKSFAGGSLKDGMFSFDLIASDSEWNEGAILDTAVNSGKSVKFSEIKYTSPGVYFYLMREQKAGEYEGGIRYDAGTYRVKVTVIENAGKLASVVEYFGSEGEKLEKITFENSYTVSGRDSLTLSGKKILSGRKLNDGEFTFELYATDASFAIEGLTPKTATNRDGKYSFVLTFDSDDHGKTFYYTLVEKNAGKTVNGVAYSTAVYMITVTVGDDGYGNVLAVATEAQGTDIDALNFLNSYMAEAASHAIEGKKVLEGRALENREFIFELYRSDASWKQGALVEKVTHDASGIFDFSKFSYLGGGMRYYIVKEANGGTTVDNVEYDATVYRVTIKLNDNLMGQLSSELIIEDQYGNKYNEIVFTNIYTAPPVETTEPPVETTEPPVETTEPPVETTEPPVETTEPPVETTEPPVETTEPPVETTEPPVETTEPPVETTEPPVETTEPPVETTEPPVETTEPPVETTEPPVETTEPPVETTEPPVETTEPPVETTEPPVETTEPPVETTEPPVETTEPPVETTEPPVETTEAPETTGPDSTPGTGDETFGFIAIFALAAILATALIGARKRETEE